MSSGGNPRIKLVLTLNCFLSCSLFCQELPFPVSSRTFALGGASVAATNIRSVSPLNPATLGLNTGTHVFINGGLQDYGFENTVIRVPLNYSDISLSGSLIRGNASISAISRRKGNKIYLFKYLNELTYPDSIDTSPLEKSRSLYYEYYLSVSYGKALSTNFYAGGTLKLLYSDTDQYGDKINYFYKDRFAAALDFGALFRLNSRIAVGVKIENILDSPWRYALFNYLGYAILLDDLPTRLHIGANLNPTDRTSIIIDLTDVFSTTIQEYRYHPFVNFGLEHRLSGMIVLRFGYRYGKMPKDFFDDIQKQKLVYEPGGFLSFGSGLIYKRYSIDMAISLNDRKDEILKRDVSVGKLTVEGSTFQYSLAVGYSF